MIGVPLAWAVLLLFHPKGEGDQIYLDVRDQVSAMLAVHIGMMLFIPLTAIAIYLLPSPSSRSTGRTHSRGLVGRRMFQLQC